MSIGSSEDDAIGAEAAHWLAAMRAPDADARRDAFEAWKASDPRHASAYAHVERLFALSGFAERIPGDRQTVSTGPAIPSFLGTARPRTWQPVGIAAGLAALLALGTVAYTKFSDAPAPQIAQHVNTSAPQLRHLGDGSLVLLGAASLITADVSEAIRLDAGRVRVIVAPDRAAVFVVAAHDQTIRSSGGIFDVALVGDGVEVTARRGSVTVGGQGDGPRRALEPGSTMSFDADGTPSIPEPAVVQDWPPARLDFDATALGDVLALANSFGDTPIVAATPDVARQRLTGTFDIRDNVELARKIAAALDLRITQRPGLIVLARRR